jgi:hypothetical protein
MYRSRVFTNVKSMDKRGDFTNNDQPDFWWRLVINKTCDYFVLNHMGSRKPYFVQVCIVENKQKFSPKSLVYIANWVNSLR